ncbi:MAG: ribonuclease P protein component [Myxococcales bacterium]|nr:ribonuclease P protein component [Myxococcales bacterium]
MKRDEFLHAQRDAFRRHAGHLLILSQRRPDDGPSRLGLVTSRKMGNAVHRNRFRRVLREFFRLNPALFAQGVDWVVIAKEGAGALASGQIRDEVRAALQRRPKGSVRPPSAGDAPTS